MKNGEGAQFGGVGPGLSPNAALALGLKVDVDALPRALVNRLRQGRVDLNDPAVPLTKTKREMFTNIPLSVDISAA